jgi:voltage-gated sodium channel
MPWTEHCRTIADSERFKNAIVAVIVLNAATLGLETYRGVTNRYDALLHGLDRTFLAVFAVELVIRIGAFGRRPQDFFRSGWNVFDFTVVAAAFIPGLSAQSTLLRLIRLLRVARLIAVIPELRVLAIGFVHSLRAVGGLALLTLILVYVYAVLGWSMFAEGDPQRWGNLNRSMMTLFQVLTLEGWIDFYETAQAINSWAWAYFLSFILIATFVVLNMVIGVVLASLEEARKATASKIAAGDGTMPAHLVHRRIAEIRAALDELDRELPAPAGSSRGAEGSSVESG